MLTINSTSTSLNTKSRARYISTQVLKYHISSPDSKREPEAHSKPLTNLYTLIKDPGCCYTDYISERLTNIKDASHQAMRIFFQTMVFPHYYAYISLYLIEGHINGCILNILRTIEVERMSLINSFLTRIPSLSTLHSLTLHSHSVYTSSSHLSAV